MSTTLFQLKYPLKLSFELPIHSGSISKAKLPANMRLGLMCLCLIGCQLFSSSVQAQVAPVSLPDTAFVLEDDSVEIFVLANDTDVDFDIQFSTLTIVSSPTAAVTNIDTIVGSIYYLPFANFNGADSLSYSICDSTGLCDTAWVILTVNPVNDSPTALDDMESTPEGTPLVIEVIANDSDPLDPSGGIDTMSIGILTSPMFGSISLILADGAVSYIPDPGFDGFDSIQYRICDLGNPLPPICDTAWAFIEVFIASPTAVIDSITGTEDNAFSGFPLSNDIDPQNDIDPGTLVLLDGPFDGIASIDVPTGLLTYTPSLNFNGTDSVRYLICDSTALCDSNWVILTIDPINDPVIVNPDSAFTFEDIPVSISVFLNDNDTADLAGGIDNSSILILTPPANGVLLIDTLAGSVLYTPNLDFSGIDQFIYQVCDLGFPLPATCDQAIVTITINPINDNPIVNGDSAMVTEDLFVVTNVLLNDSDPEEGSLMGSSVSIITDALHGFTMVNIITGQITYTPFTDYNGTDSYVYQACDTLGLCDTAMVSIVISPVNDDPTVAEDSTTTNEDMAVVIPVLINDDDDDDPLGGLDLGSLTISIPPSFGVVLVDTLTGQISYTPNADYFGDDEFFYEICDLGNPLPAICLTAKVKVEVLSVNDPPIVNFDIDTIPEDIATVTSVLVNDTDLEDITLSAASVSIFAPAANGVLSVSVLTGKITYTPNINFNGFDSYQYEACDLDGACDTAVVDLVITSTNDAPVVLTDMATTSEDVSLVIDVLINDEDLADPLGGIDANTVTIISGPFNGTAVPDAVGLVTYTPDLDYGGPDSFQYQVCDLGVPLPSLCTSAWVIIDVISSNDPPVALDDIGATLEDDSVMLSVLDNDSDVEDISPDPSTVSAVSGPFNGSTSVDVLTGIITYTPIANFNGLDSFAYSVCDFDGLCDIAIAVITVDPVNDPPIAVDDFQITLEETPLTALILGDDSDPFDPLGGIDPSSAIEISGPFHGAVSFSGVTGALTYTPDLDFNGIDSIRYQVCDLGFPLPALCTDALLRMIISAVNDAPVVLDDAETTPAGISVDADVTSNDSDPKDPLGGIDATSVSILTAALNGSTSVNPLTGVITYTPSGGFLGLDSFTYQVCDLGNPLPAICGIATVIITVSDEAPTAFDDMAGTTEESAVLIDVLVNDTDPQPNIDPTSVSIVSPASNGSTSVHPVTGIIHYTPNTNFNGIDEFEYQVCDLDLLCDQATVTVAVLPVNDPPVLLPDMLITPEDMAGATIVIGNDSDPNDPLGNIDPSTILISTFPVNGSVSVDLGSGIVTYTPNANYFGPDLYTYTVCDDGNPLPALCNSANVLIDVLSINDLPLVVNDNVSTLEDTPIGIDVLDNDSDIEDTDLDPASVNLISSTSNGSLSLLAGIFTYTPDPDFNGTDNFLYEACDFDGACDIALVTITVGPENDPPVILADVASTLEDNSVSINVVVNDSDPDDPGSGINPSSVTITLAPSNGAAVPDGAGNVLYAPDLHFNGTDVFTYQVCDIGLPLPAECGTAIVTIIVSPVNDAPIAIDDIDTTPEETAVSTDVLANDNDAADPMGGLDPSSVSIVSTPSNGSVLVNAVTGEITYTPMTGFTGTDSYSYEVCDEGFPLPSLCATAVVDILVSNEAPVANDDMSAVAEDAAVVIDVLDNDTDPQDNIDSMSVSIIIPPANGTAIVSGTTGTIQYIPGPDYNGTDAFNYQVCDLDGFCDQALVTIIVLPVNDPPVALNDSETTLEDIAITTSVLLNDSDPLDPLGNIDGTSVTIITPPLNGITTVDPFGNITYTPNADFNGADTYVYEVCDDGNPMPGLCDNAFVVITIDPVDDSPLAIDDALSTGPGIGVDIDVLANDIDPDFNIDPASVTVLTGPDHGSTAVDLISGEVNYNPDPGYVGLDTFVYRVCDLTSFCDEATVIITIAPQPPVAVNDTVAGDPDEAIIIDILSNDIPGTGALDPGSVLFVSIAANGSLSTDAFGAVTYTPDLGFCGPDSFIYAVCDENSLCASASVFISISCVVIDAVDDIAQTTQGIGVQIDILANDSGNADPDCISISVSPNSGVVEILADGIILYTPDAEFSGVDCFKYTVCDSTETAFAEAEVCVEVLEEVVLQVPGAFSPNNDGFNDAFVIPGLNQYPNNQLIIFNRWESQVYTANSYDGTWTGSWEVNGEALPDGTYFYILILDPSSANPTRKTGSIQIMR